MVTSYIIVQKQNQEIHIGTIYRPYLEFTFLQVLVCSLQFFQGVKICVFTITNTTENCCITSLPRHPSPYTLANNLSSISISRMLYRRNHAECNLLKWSFTFSSIMLLRFTQVVACNTSLFHFTVEYTPWYGCITICLITHLWKDLCCFQFWAITSKADMNIHVQKLPFLWDEYSGMLLLSHVVNICLTF